MKYFFKFFPLMALALMLFDSCNSPKTQIDLQQTKSQNDNLQEWQNQKYSMFIHWGIYSIPAGIWNDKQITGYSEQIKGHAKIPTSEYRELAKSFNPTKWDADAVAQLAKEAGMKSIVITAKHHDGFSMFDTKYSQFDVVDATPYKKDVIKELSDACRRHGLKFGVYFSLIDWDYEGALPFVSTRNSDSIPPAHHQYNLNQVEELLTNYGDISEMWFDMSAPTYQQSKEIADLVKKLQPNCLVSGRIWNDQGDFVVMGDNYKPKFKMGVPWQTPASMFHETWSYRSWQERTDLNGKIEEKIHDLLNIISAGGNYLLNIGPKADGSIVPFERDVLKAVGEWLKVNGEAIYNTHESVIEKPSWGYITAKPGQLYLSITDFPENNKLVLEGVNAKVRKIYPLANPDTEIPNQFVNGNLEINLPESMTKDRFATVIVVEYTGDLSYTPSKLIALDDNPETILHQKNGVKYHSYSGHDYYSSKPTVIKLKWHVTSHKKENYMLTLNYPKNKGTDELSLNINGEDFIFTTNTTPKNAIEIKLPNDIVNAIELSYKKSDNPHKGLNTDGLNIQIK